MIELLTADPNKAFTIALGVMIGIGLMEGVGLLFGAGLSAALESVLPDVDLDVDIDIDGPEAATPVFSRLLGWLRLGQVPVLMLLLVFLTAFGLAGLFIQAAARGLFGGFLPGWLAAAPAILIAVPSVRVGGGLLALVLPREETDAVSEESFIGRIATITLGQAAVGCPAEAKLQDEHGFTHYVMVEPDSQGETFAAGSHILLTERHGAVFRGIRNTTDALVD